MKCMFLVMYYKMLWQVICLSFWSLVFLDSVGCLMAKHWGEVGCWYERVFPSMLTDSFPLQNAWPVWYFVLASIGLVTIVALRSDPSSKRSSLPMHFYQSISLADNEEQERRSSWFPAPNSLRMAEYMHKYGQ